MTENHENPVARLARNLRLNGSSLQERLAVVLVVAVVIIIPIWLHSHKMTAEARDFPPGVKVFNVTGLGSQGRWTLEEVNGLNYWWKSFARMELTLEPGDLVGLRLQSADVAHIFYCPTLHLGPVYIEPGHVRLLSFRADRPGVHYYYCMSICGECHYFMRGKIVIGKGQTVEPLPEDTMNVCPRTAQEPLTQDLYDRGNFLFQRMGCIACHGERGRGDVTNPNYVNRTIPRLNGLAERMFLYSPKTAGLMAQVIMEGKTADQMEISEMGIPQQTRVLAQYRTVRNVIRTGRQPARSDTTSFTPPLAMPAWGTKLTERDIDAILVFLLRNQVWEDKDE